MSLTLSKLPHGLLNDKLRERVYESFDVQRDSIGAVLRRVLNAQFSENYSDYDFIGIGNPSLNQSNLDIYKKSL